MKFYNNAIVEINNEIIDLSKVYKISKPYSDVAGGDHNYYCQFYIDIYYLGLSDESLIVFYEDDKIMKSRPSKIPEDLINKVNKEFDYLIDYWIKTK